MRQPTKVAFRLLPPPFDLEEERDEPVNQSEERKRLEILAALNNENLPGFDDSPRLAGYRRQLKAAKDGRGYGR